MVVPASTATRSNGVGDMRRKAHSRRGGSDESGKKKPSLGTGGHSKKGSKEIPENELELKIAENEFRRRQWLMNWHMEVVDMQNELYDMEQTLQKSMVRTDSAKQRDKQAKKEASAPQMTAEEIEKLPVRMRPRPKYEPYGTRRERSEINIRSYNRVIENLQAHPRRFDVFSPDPTGRMSHFPEMTLNSAEHYRVLLLRNPFYRNTERDALLLKLKLEPSWQPTRGLAPKKMIASRNTEPSSLPLLRGNTDLSIKPATRGADKSVRFGAGQQTDNLPSINNKTNIRKPQTAEPSVRPVNQHLPAVSESKESQQINMVAKVNKPRPVTSDGSRSSRSKQTSSPTSSLSSLNTDFDSQPDDHHVKARQTAKAKNPAKLPKIAAKKEPDILEDSEFRRSLLQQLEGDRKKRLENTKWGLVAKTFKASTFLKVQMPDVIKDASTSKHHNRAIEQVQERIKARAEAEAKAKAKEKGAFGGFSTNLVKSKGMSQSMPVLSK